MQLRSLFLPLCVLLGLATPAWSQLDLPRGKRVRVQPTKGLELPPAPDKRSLMEEAFGEPAPEDAAPAEPEEAGPERLPSELLLPEIPLAGLGRSPEAAPNPASEAAAVFERLIRSARGSRLEPKLLAQLSALGEPVLELARAQLPEKSTKRSLLAGRLLLSMGGAPERLLVRDFLSSGASARVGPELLRALAERDPLLVNPTYLMELLEHPEARMREAAAALASESLDESWLPLLVATSSSKSAGLRLHGIELASQLRSPGARRMLLAALEDRRSTHSLLAARALSSWPEEGTLELLRARAFGRAEWDRGAAYALVALVQRELEQSSALLGEADLPQLLEGLEARSELVAGASAAALAGIGFRDPAGQLHPWLERRVPDTLVRLCTGYVFHKDLQALQGIGLPRLGLISGEPWGSNGGRWQAWWADSAEGFRPRRSALLPQPNDELNLSLTLSEGRGANAERLTLVGPGIARASSDPEQRVYYLSHSQALELMALIQEQCLLDAELLPGRYGALDRELRTLRVSMGAGEKLFEASRVDAPAWFERVSERALELSRQLAWQRWYHPMEYASSFAFYEAEGPWWEQVEPREGALRLKRMMLERLEEAALEQRAEGLAEFASHVQGRDLLDRSDFVPLMGLLRAEGDYGTRFSATASSPARLLVQLAIEAARQPQGGLEALLARDLFEHLHRAYGPAARVDLQRLLELSGGALLREASQSPDALLRRVSARPLGLALAELGSAAEPGLQMDRELFLGLLSAEEVEVASAALAAVDELGLTHFQDHALRLAQPGSPAQVRAAALRALGSLGTEGLRAMCIQALGEEDPGLVLAAVESLAQARDERNLGLLTALFARGSESGFFEAAREGLRGLGSAAHPELLAQVVSGDPELRRAAALLLAEGGVPQAASELLMLLTEDPEDQRVAEELAILSAVDLRAEQDPVSAWWSWWDGVVHDDAEAWFLAALAREGLPPARSAAPDGEQTSVGLEDLLGWVHVKQPILRERLRRELSRRVDADLEPIPSQPAALGDWLQRVRALAKEGS